MSRFEKAGKDRDALRKVARTLIEEVGRPHEGESVWWHHEVSREDAAQLIDYLSGVWNVERVEVGGCGSSFRSIQMQLSDVPISVSIYDGDAIVDFELNDHGELAPTLSADDLVSRFEKAGKDRDALRKLARTLIEKVGRPQEGESVWWHHEVSREDAAQLIDYLSGVWNVKRVEVGGGAPRYIEIQLHDAPIGVWILEEDVIEEFESYGPGHMGERYWDPGMVLMCNDRRYDTAEP